jgi:hypothetical protein
LINNTYQEPLLNIGVDIKELTKKISGFEYVLPLDISLGIYVGYDTKLPFEDGIDWGLSATWIVLKF